MSFTFKAIAKNPPGIFIVAGAFLYAGGALSNYPTMMNTGLLCFILGFVLQIGYLCTRVRF